MAYKSIFAEPITQKRSGGYQSIYATKKESPVVATSNVFNFNKDLGGGQYNAGDATSTRSYAGIDSPGQYREHIFPLALGGTSNFDNIKVYGKDVGEQKAKYEVDIIDQYKKGKLSLPEARGLVLKKYRELTGLDPKQGVMANLPEAIKETVKAPIDFIGNLYNKAKDKLTSYAQPKPGEVRAIDVAREAQGILGRVSAPSPEDVEKAKQSKYGSYLTKNGMLLIVDKKTGKVTQLDAIAGVGSLKNVAKEGLDDIGRQLLKNIESKVFKESDIIAPKVLNQTIENQAGRYKSIFNEADGLAQEAKKYKSTDEFVKAQGTPVYRGGADLSKEKITDAGISVSKGKNIAEDFVKQKGGAVQENFISPNAKIIDYSEIPGVKFKNLNDYSPELDIGNKQIWKDLEVEYQKAVDWAKSNGYDGVKLPLEGETRIINPESLKTKSQLTDIWNKANKTTKAVDDITNEMGVAKLPQSLVSVAESIAPIKHQDDVVKKVFKNWTRELLVGEEKANQRLAKIPQVADNFDTILKYEQGVDTPYSKTIKEEFDALYKKAQDAGIKSFDDVTSQKIDVPYRKNYVPQVYNDTLKEVKTAMSRYMEDQGVDNVTLELYLQGIKDLPETVSKSLKLNPFFSKERAFPDYKTAMDYGLTPKYTEPGQLLAHYDAELNKAVANRKFIDSLVARKKIATVESAGSDWEALTLPFSPKGYYAPPTLAKMLNGMFRNEATLSLLDKGIKGIANTSKAMQTAVLSAGVPGTTVNFFATGVGLVKEVTAGNFKAAVNFIKANFNQTTIKYFNKNAKYFELMAEEGINTGNRAGNYKTIYQTLSNTKGIANKIGLAWDKAFNEKTFNNLLPMNQLDMFKGVYDKAIKSFTHEEAKKLAGDTVKGFYGLFEEVGRAKGTEDALSATFFAPKFREGIIRTLFNTGKSITTEIFNPAFRKNRNLATGMLISYAGYNALNKKLTGHYMWENPDGKEFDLMIPTELGNTQDDIIYIGFMPSFLSFARNLASGGIALAKGDTSTAKQKIGSLFSMPIKVASELWANKDYFGREIYKEFDDNKTKLKKMASYAFLSVNHPFIKETYNQLTTDKPLYQSISEAMEMPVKFSSYTKIEKQEFYEAIDKQKAVEARAKADFTPKYTEIRTLLDQGKIEEATSITSTMNKEDYAIYQSLKRADKTRADVDQQIKMFDKYKQIKELMANGQVEQATAITGAMNKEQYAAYRQLKAKLE